MHNYFKIKNNIYMSKKLTKQKEGWYIFFIIFLGSLLVASLGLFVHNPLMPNVPASTGLKPLGTDIQLTIDDSGSISQTLYFYGSYLPEFEVPQNSSVSLSPKSNDAKIRAKVYVYDEHNNLININATTTTEWTVSADGYYYYNGTMTPNLTVQFSKGVTLPKGDANLSSNNIYLIIMTFETLPADSNFAEIWGQSL